MKNRMPEGHFSPSNWGFIAWSSMGWDMPPSKIVQIPRPSELGLQTRNCQAWNGRLSQLAETHRQHPTTRSWRHSLESAISAFIDLLLEDGSSRVTWRKKSKEHQCSNPAPILPIGFNRNWTNLPAVIGPVIPQDQGTTCMPRKMCGARMSTVAKPAKPVCRHHVPSCAQKLKNWLCLERVVLCNANPFWVTHKSCSVERKSPTTASLWALYRL